MTIVNPRRYAVLLVLIAGALLVNGCSQDAQEKYNDAAQALQQAKKKQKQAQQNLDDEKDKLADLREKVRQAQAKVQKASDKVDHVVNDEVLFRTLQRKLLDNDKFDAAAISVGVQNRVVTLEGNVPDRDTKKRALKIARSQWGVKNVVDKLQVAEKQSAPNDASSGQQDQTAQQDKTSH